MKTNRHKFHTHHGIPPEGTIDLRTIADLSKLPMDALTTVYRRAMRPKEGAKADPFNEKKKPQKPVSIGGAPKKKSSAETSASFSVPASGKGKGFNRIYAFAMAHHAGKGKFGKDEDIARIFGLLPVVPPPPVIVAAPEPEAGSLLQYQDSSPTSSHRDCSDYDDDL
jgi:hypothetical protein